ncbi:MAG: metallophosphoesterase [Solirubrobacterales bacterium]|nr:metallophosphoesterase [Solirubrobacterales bacterium]
MSTAVVVAIVAVALAAAGAEQSHGRSFVPSSAEKRAEVWAVGDGADGSSESYAVSRMVARAKPDRFLYLGDVYPKGTAADFAERYEPTYGRVAAVTAPTVGNHESGNREYGYDPYWRAVHGSTPPSYYAFRVGGWKVISLNSEIDHSPGSPQLRWLRRRVQSPGNCRIAFWHRPWLNAGTTHPGAGSVASFWDALQGHARLVLNGHEHNMQRQAPTQGMIQLIAGSGGNDQYPLNRNEPGLRFGNDTSAGALRLRLAPRRVRFAFVDTTGRVLDRGTRRCRPNV